MSKRNAKAVRCDGEAFFKDAPPGAFRFYSWHGSDKITGMHFTCPCGCGRVHGASFDRWTWDGNTEAPTLSPSLGLHAVNGKAIGPDGKYHWHGFLKAGQFEEC